MMCTWCDPDYYDTSGQPPKKGKKLTQEQKDAAAVRCPVCDSLTLHPYYHTDEASGRLIIIGWDCDTCGHIEKLDDT